MAFITSCNGPAKMEESKDEVKTEPILFLEPQSEPQIAEYIRNIFQDKNGNFWFGTNGYGVAHYNGENVSYYSISQGFNGQQVTGISEDLDGNVWFSTDHGVVKYDWSVDKNGGKQFTNYTDSKYFGGQRFWSIFVDSKNHVWAGGAKELFRFNGTNWAPFELPYPEEVKGEFITTGTTWFTTEDRDGNLWFSTNGFGAFKYDGNSFTQYSKKDGLTDNSVDNILEDRKGNVWFGTREGGVSEFNGISFTNYTANDSIGNNEVCVIFEDKAGNIWMSSEGFGVYRFDGESFTNYGEKQGLGVRAVQTIFEDTEGRLWVGGGGGLFCFDGESFFNVTASGPWKL